MNNSQKPKTKRQHYVPVFLLKHFCNEEGKITVYDKQKGKTFSAHPKDICFENYLYEAKLNDQYFANPNSIENSFAQKESEWSTLIDHIIKNCDNPNNDNAFIVTRNEKRQLADFFYNLFARNPYNMEMMHRSMEQLGWHDEVHLFANYGFGEDSHMCKYFDLHLAFEDHTLQNEFCNDLLQSYFYVGVTSNGSFPTSDCPFYISGNIRLYGFIPITPKYIFIWSAKKIGQRANCKIFLHQTAAENLKKYYMDFKAVNLIITNNSQKRKDFKP